MKKLLSIILSGGDGNRLWPLSNEKSPKPFIEIAGKSLLEKTLRRAKLVSNEVIIVTNEKYLDETKKIITNIPNPPKIHFILEPVGRDTAPAVSIALRYIEKTFKEDVLCLLLPADHEIKKQVNFKEDIEFAKKQIGNKNSIIFGVKPEYPEIGFGYIEVKNKLNDIPSFPVKRFVEKPNQKNAEKFIKSNNFFWNSGMVIFDNKTMSKNFEINAPKIWNQSAKIFSRRKKNLSDNSVSFSLNLYAKFKKQSLDYAIMEKMKNLLLVPVSFEWSDLGTWKALSDKSPKDKKGNSLNVKDKNSIFLDNSKNIHLQILENSKKLYALLGIKDLVVADFPDALLVAKKSQNEEIKGIVEKIKRSSVNQDINQEVFRPWGSYMTLLRGPGFQVKIIKININQAISLQYHKLREEHWVILKGRGTVQIDKKERRIKKGDYINIKRNEIHRIHNIGKQILSLIEVQLGTSTSEKDIVRIEDLYGRK